MAAVSLQRQAHRDRRPGQHGPRTARTDDGEHPAHDVLAAIGAAPHRARGGGGAGTRRPRARRRHRGRRTAAHRRASRGRGVAAFHHALFDTRLRVGTGPTPPTAARRRPARCSARTSPTTACPISSPTSTTWVAEYSGWKEAPRAPTTKW
ncbi:hypothetical protein ACRAWF_24900 [Streptomyces sp. L7]